MLQNILHAQLGDWAKVSSLEFNASINSGKFFSPDSINISNIFMMDSISYSRSGDTGFELQVKYVNDFAPNLAWYSGLYLGRFGYRTNSSVADTITSFGNFRERDFIDLENGGIFYASLIGGIRAGLFVFKNDRVNLSLGGKLTLIPKQNLSFTQETFSEVRSENISYESTTSLDNNGNIFASLEADINYQLIPKDERYRYMIGILIDRNNTNIFRSDTNINLTSSTHSFGSVFKGGHFGLYVGFAYILGKSDE